MPWGKTMKAATSGRRSSTTSKANESHKFGNSGRSKANESNGWGDSGRSKVNDSKGWGEA